MPEEKFISEIDAITEAYISHLTEKIRRVYIFGDTNERELEKVFVELSIVDEYRRPSVQTKYGLSGTQSADREKRIIKPDDLLEGVVQAVIVGAPGCGKTTLLKYLTLKTLGGGQRLPIFLELKTISKESFQQANNNLGELLADKAISYLKRFGPAGCASFRQFFFDCLAAGKVTIFLDGLDEVRGSDFFTILCNAINEFKQSDFGNNTMIISTRPYALQARIEGLREMEIVPLNNEQIRDFLIHYYGNDLLTKRLLEILVQRHQLRELARVPFLLSVIANLHRNNDGVAETQLEIYRQIVWHLISQIDREKSIERAHFYIYDPEGRIKLDFLMHLAFERLLIDEVGKGVIKQESAHLIFNGDILLEKAKQFLELNKRTDINPYWLASDVKATPLLREVGADVFAFAHLTIQEYLAAVSLSRNPDCRRIFCAAYFDPSLVEMEVLPMTLGLVRNPDDFYAALEQLPESLNYANLRLRARGLAYLQKMDENHRTPLIDLLVEFVTAQTYEMTPYADVVIKSFSGAGAYCSDLILDRMVSLLNNAQGQENEMGWYMASHITDVLEMLGGDRSMEIVLNALKHRDRTVRCELITLLDDGDDERVVNALIESLNDKDVYVRDRAAHILGEMGNKHAIYGLVNNLSEKEHDQGFHASYALRKIGGEEVVESLINALQAADADQRYWATETLKAFEGERSIDGLLLALKDVNQYIRQHAAEALGRIRNERAIEGLLITLRDADKDVREKAAAAIVTIKGKRAIEGLINALKDDDRDARVMAAKALGNMKAEIAIDALNEAIGDADSALRITAVNAIKNIGGRRAAQYLQGALKSKHSDVRSQAVMCIGGSDKRLTTGLLLTALKDESYDVRCKAASALSMLPDQQAVDSLLTALKDENTDVCINAAQALSMIGGEEALKGLHEALTSANYIVRWRIVAMLGDIGGTQVVEWLIEALHDSNVNDFNVDVYIESTRSLTKIGGERAVDGLLLALKHEHEAVRESAARGLGRIGGERAVEPLIEALKDTSYQVCESAARALEWLGDERAIDGLIEVLNANCRNITVWNAERALAVIGGEKAVRALLNAPKVNPRNEYTDVLSLLHMFENEQAIEVVKQLLRDEDRDVRLNAAKTLASHNDKTAVGSLMIALKDEDPEIRNIAAAALHLVSKDGSIDSLKDREHDIRDKIKVAVENVGGDCLISALLYVLRNKDPFVREDAAKALENIETKVMGKGLLEAIHNEDAFVRRKSAEVIGYYTSSEQALQGLLSLTEKDSDAEVSLIAEESINKLIYKINLNKINKEQEMQVSNTQGKRIKVLFLSANPTPTSRLKLDEEIRAITEKIRASAHRDLIEIISVWAARPDDLLQVLNEHQPHIMHFSGHGSKSEEIILNDNNGKPKPVSKKALVNLFRVLKGNVQVVLLNACYSKAQAEGIIEVIPCTIGMRRSIGDNAAITFAASFYRAIGFGRSVQEAFDQGISALLLESIPEEDNPQLLTQNGVDASGVILVNPLSPPHL